MAIKRLVFFFVPLMVAVAFTNVGGQESGPGYPLALFVGRSAGDTQAWEYFGDQSIPPWVRNAVWDLPDIGGYSVPCFGDLDSDGDADALVGRSQGDCYGYENVGSASAPAWQRNSLWDCPDVGYYGAPDLADLDADGDLDLVMGNSDGVVSVFENTGNAAAAQWTRNTAWGVNGQVQYAFPRLCHLDGDSALDLLIGSRYDGVRAFRNAGSSTTPIWQRMSAWDLLSGSERTTLAAGDLDGDGDCDLLLGERGGLVYAYRNTGNLSSGPIWVPEHDWDLGTNAGGYSAVALMGGVAGGPGPSQPPFAEAGPDQTLVDQDRSGLEQATLYGGDSTDPDGTIVSYAWREGNYDLGTGQTLTLDLAVGTHFITLAVTDDEGNMATDTLTVTIQSPETSEPPGPISDMEISSVTLGFHYHNVPEIDTYGPADYLYLSAYLQKEAGESFVIPSEASVTIRVEIPDPVVPASLREVFVQTLPPGAVTGSADRYRFTTNAPGIFDLEFSTNTATAVYFYLELGKIMYLPEYKNASCHESLGCELTALEYRNEYVLPISSVFITVEIGEEAWRGGAALEPGDYNEHYQKLVMSNEPVPMPGQALPPSAEAGPDQSLVDQDGDGREQATLDGGDSLDPDGTIVSYVWSEDANDLGSGQTLTLDLAVGMHHITLTVTDNAGNRASDMVMVTIASPETPEPPAGQFQDIIDQKIKITFSEYAANDLYNMVAYLVLPEGDGFQMNQVCSQDVTVTVSVIDPQTSQERVLFSETIPAGTVSPCTSKYRAVLSGPDLREVSIEPSTATRIYLYVYGWKGDYPITDPTVAAAVERSRLTVQIGDRVWSGWSDGFGAQTNWSRLKPCTGFRETLYLGSKVELVCNR